MSKKNKKDKQSEPGVTTPDSAIDQEQLMKDIKAMEKKAREEAMKNVMPSQAATEQQEILFDAWYAIRASRIPGRHMKEILRADFNGRGLGNKETMEKFDLALEKYGVKLK